MKLAGVVQMWDENTGVLCVKAQKTQTITKMRILGGASEKEIFCIGLFTLFGAASVATLWTSVNTDHWLFTQEWYPGSRRVHRQFGLWKVCSYSESGEVDFFLHVVSTSPILPWRAWHQIWSWQASSSLVDDLVWILPRSSFWQKKRHELARSCQKAHRYLCEPLRWLGISRFVARAGISQPGGVRSLRLWAEHRCVRHQLHLRRCWWDLPLKIPGEELWDRNQTIAWTLQLKPCWNGSHQLALVRVDGHLRRQDVLEINFGRHAEGKLCRLHLSWHLRYVHAMHVLEFLKHNPIKARLPCCSPHEEVRDPVLCRPGNYYPRLCGDHNRELPQRKKLTGSSNVRSWRYVHVGFNLSNCSSPNANS